MIKTLQRYGMFGKLQWVVTNAGVALSRIAFFFSFFIKKSGSAYDKENTSK